MSTVASPGSRAGSGGLKSKRGTFQEWRRSRPFWGCAIGIFAGVEIYLVAAAPLKVMAMQGLPGLLTLMIALAAVVLAGVTLFQPHLRTLTGIIVAILGPISIMATNLGGFVIGMILLIVAGALMVAWQPAEGVIEGEAALAADVPTAATAPTGPAEPAPTTSPTTPAPPTYSWQRTDDPAPASSSRGGGIMDTMFGARRSGRPASTGSGPNRPAPRPRQVARPRPSQKRPADRPATPGDSGPTQET